MNTTLQQLMERNVLEVFAERDSGRRKAVINELYTENCTFNDFETDDRSFGRDALNAKVEHLLEGAPGFVFRLAGPAQVIHDLGWMLRSSRKDAFSPSTPFSTSLLKISRITRPFEEAALNKSLTPTKRKR
jgi:hypothetical protein